MIYKWNVDSGALEIARLLDEAAENMQEVMDKLANADGDLLEAIGSGAGEYDDAGYGACMRKSIEEMRESAYTVVINAYWWIQNLPQKEEKKESEDNTDGED